MRKLSVFGLFFVAPLIFASPGAHAASVKVDVCHSEGNGSFHLINISDKAVPAHRRHGDALPFEGVPGAPGFDFDVFCDQVSASTCPSDFSASGLAEVFIDGSGEELCADLGHSVTIDAVEGPGGDGSSHVGGCGPRRLVRSRPPLPSRGLWVLWPLLYQGGPALCPAGGGLPIRPTTCGRLPTVVAGRTVGSCQVRLVAK